jgi:hypothetical protein
MVQTILWPGIMTSTADAHTEMGYAEECGDLSISTLLGGIEWAMGKR